MYLLIVHDAGFRKLIEINWFVCLLQLIMALCTFGTGELDTISREYMQLYSQVHWTVNQEYLLVFLTSQKADC